MCLFGFKCGPSIRHGNYHRFVALFKLLPLANIRFARAEKKLCCHTMRRLSMTSLMQFVLLWLLSSFCIVSSAAEAYMTSVSALTDDPPLNALVAGSEFGVKVNGGAFDVVNDKVMLVPHFGTTCGLSAPPAGSPDSVLGYAATSCEYHGAAATKLMCRGLRVFIPGRYQVCVCDAAGGNITKALPQLVNPAESGCASLERYFLSTNVGYILIEGPNQPGTTQALRTGAPHALTISGSQLSSNDRIRIVHDSQSCHNLTHNKTNHEAVGGNPLVERSSDSGNVHETWTGVRVFKTGSYHVCWCGNNPSGCDGDDDFVVHASTLVVSGPIPKHLPLTCVTGVPFGIRLDGQGLSLYDRIMIINGQRECGESVSTDMHLHGAQGRRDEGDSSYSKWDGVILDGSGTSKICWCGAMSSSCSNCCLTKEEFNIWAGNITVGGPRQARHHRPALGMPFTYTIEGWGLSTDDRISIVDFTQLCNRDGAEKWSDGVYRASDQIGLPPQHTVGDQPENKTSQSWSNLVLKSMRQYRVCWCARNINGCKAGTNFALTIGTILPMGPSNVSTPLSVVPGLPFSLTLHGEQGSKLSTADRVRIVRKDIVLGECGNSGTRQQADEVDLTACDPECVYSPISNQPELLNANETEKWYPVQLSDSGTFLVCWCPNGLNQCINDEDFLVQTGVIKAAGAEQGRQFKCATDLDCKLQVPDVGSHAAHLSDNDYMQLIVDSPGTKCGITVRADATSFSSGTRIKANAVSVDGETKLEFAFGKPKTIGLFRVCYCQDVNACAEDMNFFQDVGQLSISGIASTVSVFVCYVRTDCHLRLAGTDLASEDSVVLNTLSAPCGGPGNEPSNFLGGQVTTGNSGAKRYLGTARGMDVSGNQVFEYKFGKAPTTGSFRLCFCKSDMATSQQCMNRYNHAQGVGNLHVRGTENRFDRSCSQGRDCVFKLRSLTLSYKDRVILIDENSTCGDANAKVADWVAPLAPFDISPDQQTTNLEAASFRIGIAIPGRFRICYCADVEGAESCVDTPLTTTTIGGGRRLQSTQELPNLIRYGLDVGKLTIDGAMKDVRTVPDLPSTASVVTVEVQMQLTGKHVSCIATEEQAPADFIPTNSDLIACVEAEQDLTQTQRLFPRCVGVGKTHAQTTMGWSNFVHVPPVGIRDGMTQFTKLYVWCYTHGECESDRCLFPPNNRGVEVTLTAGLNGDTLKTGLKSMINRWPATVATAFPLAVGLEPNYLVDPAHARIKIIEQGQDCNMKTLFPGVKPLTCEASSVGKCEPPPQQFITGASRELVWDNVIVPRGGEFRVCYCDRHYGQRCHMWYEIGTVDSNGPLYARESNFVGNPGRPFKISVRGRGLSITNRVRILPKGSLCTSETAPDVPSGPPSTHNDTFESFDITITEKGESVVCWCGGESGGCTEPSQFTVRLGPLQISDKRDCKLSEWFVVGACSEPCGGGTQTLRRGIAPDGYPTGGGAECPSEDQLNKVEPCNTDPCALARVDRIWTVPAEVHEMEPFQVHVQGNSFNRNEDKILIVASDVNCGESQSHFGGADCATSGSDDSLLICGDGVKSIKSSSAGMFKVCVCDASAAEVENFDGDATVSAGSMSSGALASVGCAKPSSFRLAPPAQDGAIINVLKAAEKKSEDGSSGGTIGLAIALICSGLVLVLCAGIGLFLYYRLTQKTKIIEEEGWEDEETGDAGLVANQGAPPMQALPSPYEMQALPAPAGYNYYGQYEQQLALANSQQMMALTNGFEPPPPTPYGPLALAPPPPMAPPKMSLPPSLSPRLGNTSPRSASPRIGRGMSRQKTFSDLVNEAQKASPARSFSQMNLTPLPTPTGTPRECTTPLGGTPRGGTPRGNEADKSMLAIEDNRPETVESQARPLSSGSAFQSTGSSWRPSTADSDNRESQARPLSSGSAFQSTGSSWRPSTADSESTISDFSSVSTHQAQAFEPSIPKLPLLPIASSVANQPLPGIEEHPCSASSGASSLAHSESTIGGGQEKSARHKKRPSAAEISALTESALQAHDSAASSRTEPETGSTPRAIKSMFGGMSNLFRRDSKSDGKVGGSTTPGRSWVSDESGYNNNSDASKSNKGKKDGSEKRNSLIKTHPLPPESEPVPNPSPPELEPSNLIEQAEAARRAAEVKAKKEAEAKAAAEAAQKAAEEKANKEAEEKAAAEAAKKAAEEKASKEAAEKAAAEVAKKAAEEMARKEAEEKAAAEVAKKAAEEKARKEAEEKAAAEAAKKAAEEKAKREAAEKTAAEVAKKAAEEKARKEAEEKAAAEAAKKAADEKAKAEAALVPPQPPAPEVFETVSSHEISPPSPPIPEVVETLQVHEEKFSPPEPPVPEVVDAPQRPPISETLRRAREIVETKQSSEQPPPPPKPPLPEVVEVPQQRGHPPPPPELESSLITREGMNAPPSASLRNRRSLPGMPGSPLNPGNLGSPRQEAPPPPQPPPPPKSPKSQGRPSFGPGPSLDPQHGNHGSGHSLRDWAKERNNTDSRSHSREPENSIPPSPPSPSAAPPPPPKPPKQTEPTPNVQRGPGPAFGLVVETDNLEDTIHSTGSGQSSKGSPSGKKAFSLGGMAKSTAAKAKSRPMSAVGPRDPGNHSKLEGTPLPPRPPTGKQTPTTSPRSFNAW